MLDFIELEASTEFPPKLSPCTPTVLDNLLAIRPSANLPTMIDILSEKKNKYWIEEYSGNHAHGNPWFVFTTIGPEHNPMTISIPYHAEQSVYFNCDWHGKGYNDLYDYPDAWKEWISYSKSHRQTYIREFRKNKENKQLSYIGTGIVQEFISVSCIPAMAKGAKPATIHSTHNTNCAQQETEEMNINTSEDNARRHLRDRAASMYYEHDRKLEDHFHINEPDAPATYEEALERLTSGKVTVRPKDQRRPYHAWFEHFTWRDPAHPADHDGYKKAKEKLNHEKLHLMDAIMVKAPLDGVKDLHSFESKTFH